MPPLEHSSSVVMGGGMPLAGATRLLAGGDGQRLFGRDQVGPRAVQQRKVGGARERSVVLRPGLAVLQALLQTVEAAQLAAEIVDRVHDRRFPSRREHGAAVLERAVMRQ